MTVEQAEKKEDNMQRAKLMRIILIAGSALILAGVALMGWMMKTEEERSVIRVALEEGDERTVSFEHLGLVPGEKCEYVIELEQKEAEEFILTMDFDEETNGGALKRFAHARILYDGEVVRDELLATLLEENTEIPITFGEEKWVELKIVYYLPLEVGNEAKNAEARFELLLKASNE